VSTLGADVLRLWVAATDYRGEMSVSDEILKRTADAYRRLRNTARFLLANLNGFDPDRHRIAPEAMLALDRWAVDRAWRLQDRVRRAYAENQFHLIYQLVHNFCAVDLGAYYLDVIKDRQYTTPADSVARRSAQTAMYHIAEALVRWLAPILSFTTEEAWRHLPGAGRADSVFLSTWYGGLFAFGDEAMGVEFWEQVIAVRETVGRALEPLRAAGEIGSSLDAEVDLYCEPALRRELARLGEELRFVVITSGARVYPVEEKPETAATHTLPGAGEVWVSAYRSPHPKCVRCWHHREDVGAHAEHPEICGRCVENVAGAGERRRFA
jgi:isoleucyl-tRNA synthetase